MRNRQKKLSKSKLERQKFFDSLKNLRKFILQYKNSDTEYIFRDYDELLKSDSIDCIYSAAKIWDRIFHERTCAYIEENISAWTKYYVANKDSQAINFFGNMYYVGCSVEKNLQRAEEYFQIAVEMNNSRAMLNLAKIHQQRGDNGKAFELCAKAAKLGNERAMMELYARYRDGDGVQKNSKSAAYWYEKIKDKISAVATEHYEMGINNHFCGCWNENQDKPYAQICFESALENFHTAARFDNIDAYREIGKMYLHGEGVKRNVDKAIEFFKLGGRNGYCIIASLYRDGFRVEKNIDTAIKFYAQAECWFEIGEIFRKVGDLKTAGSWYEKYFETYKVDDESDVATIAKMYRDGEDYELDSVETIIDKKIFEGAKLERDGVKAIKFFELLEEFSEVGCIYRDGLGVEKNGLLALKYFHKAAEEKQEAYAYQCIAEMYAQGDGVEKNLDAAIKYYTALANKDFNGGEFHTEKFTTWGSQGKVAEYKHNDAWEEHLVKVAEMRLKKLEEEKNEFTVQRDTE